MSASTPHPSAADGVASSSTLLADRIISESPQAIALCTTDGARHCIAHVNRSFETITGFPLPHATGRNLPDLLRPPGSHHDWEQIEDALAHARPTRQSLPLARQDGTIFWADLHLYPLGPQPSTQWVATFTDITDHLDLRDALRQSEARNKLLADNSRDIISVFQSDGTCTYLSASSHGMLGMAPEKIIGQSILSLVHPEDIPQVRAAICGHFLNRHESVFTHRLRKADNTYLWAETTGKTRRDPTTGHPLEIIACIRDISKRRIAEDSLKAMHTLLDSVYEAVPLGLCFLDNDSRITQCNRAFARLFSRTPAEVAGTSAHDILPGLGLSRASTAQGTTCECECTSSTGTPFPAELMVLPLEADSTRLVIVADLRERKRIENRLHEVSQQESLGTLAGGIAHDFNNMLAIVLGYASLLRDAAGDPARIANYADTIIDAGKRGADVVRQLQLFANTQDAELSPVDLHQLLDDTIVRTCSDWPANITLSRTFTAANARLTVDPVQFTQAIQKLLENAREAMPQGGTLTLRTAEVRQSTFDPRSSTAESKSLLRVTIQDTGIGMDTATRARMFEPFFTRTKNPEVSGLGLAVVYGIMRAHRGLIEVDSTPGQGTSIHLLLPQQAPVETAPPPVLETTAPSSDRRTILLVEDEQDIGTLWLELLPVDNWRVLWARDGGEAIRLFRAHREEIALVFTDIGLPTLDGWQVTEAIRLENPTLPLLIASGSFRSGDRQRGLAEPVAYLPKPYVPTKVLKLIKALTSTATKND